VLHIHQVLQPYFDLLLARAPFDDARVASIVAALDHVTVAVERALESLDRPANALRRAALELLDGIGNRVEESVRALTENLPSGSAYKPGDIVRFRNGKTAEIDNTDAEGRVILADALDYAKEFRPRAIVDYATLTGAALVALGLEAAIVFSDDDGLVNELVSAGERTDERLWRLPMWDDYKENIRSEWADIKNSGGRMGGSINGAMFLKEFVDKGTPWAHLDIAPTAYYERDHAGYPVGATAFGVALTLRWLRDRFGDGAGPRARGAAKKPAGRSR